METLGSRLRTLRHLRGLSIDDAARELSLSKGYLSKIENDRSVPSIACLTRMAELYRTTIAAMLGENGDASRISIVRANERRFINRSGTELGYRFAAINDRKPDRRAHAFILTLPWTDSRRLFYQHPGEELFLVLKGRIRFHYGGAEYILEEGDCVYFDSSVEHRGEAADRNGAEALSVIIPGPSRRRRATSATARTRRKNFNNGKMEESP
jgi:transcriptional regulator with XRE-family HTH domain|nr:MAG: hypothetical protein DIU57_16190 [Pseudomonadota bacterium]